VDITKGMTSPQPAEPKVSSRRLNVSSGKNRKSKKVPKAEAKKVASKRAASGRKDRKLPMVKKDDSNEGTSSQKEPAKRNYSEAAKAIESLQTEHDGYRAIQVGHLRSHIQIGQADEIAKRINDAVGMLNRARAIAERATEALLDNVVVPDDIPMLKQLTHGSSGARTYWTNLLRLIISGGIGNLVSAENRPIQEKIQEVLGKPFLKSLDFFAKWPGIKLPMLTVMMQGLAKQMDTAFTNQVIGMLPLLKDRVVEVVGEDVKTTIKDLEKQLAGTAPAYLFYKINQLLPLPYRWSVVPHTSFGDGYISMTC
jgi:hypothetical protein